MMRTVRVNSLTLSSARTCIATHGPLAAVPVHTSRAAPLASLSTPRDSMLRRHRKLVHGCDNTTFASLISLACPFRGLFGGWRASSAVSTNDAPPTTTTTAAAAAAAATCTSPTTATTPTSAATTADASNDIKQLRQQVLDLKEALEASQETVKQLLVLTASQKATNGAAAPCSDPSHPCGPCSTAATAAAAKHARGACYVVRTSEELVDALRGRGSEHASRTILLDGSLFVLDLFARVEVDQARVSIVGNNATVVGQISVKGRGAVLSASDVFFLCPHDLQLRLLPQSDTASPSAAAVQTTVNAVGKKEKENAAHLVPVLSATAGAGIHLDRCVVSNGRDGVYLGMGSHCTLNHVRIVNCIRGLYEGVGCRTSIVSNCVFMSNRYDMVLLGMNNAERAGRMYKKALKATAGGTAGGAGVNGSGGGAPASAQHSSTTFTATFSASATSAEVLPAAVTTTSVLALQQNKAQVVLQHNPITDIYEDCWIDGQKVELTGPDATSGLSDPLF